ncbi:hypothetical protein [Anabaena subtropica]|uniref:DUF4267 domain-containing protein n=1 Tax=Anabaena subtropica FACHB-260 TaxID=2692884 RepID=A0ABR8CRG9_9NOST|nr:hypothetical protein [Anabaena subtropica]MBD2345133.1 hypothetical protein [Anabaena subtropica FACHB-260]
MRNQIWYVAVLIGVMCIIRFSLSAIAYADPQWLMTQLDIPLTSNIQMPYIIRVWAIRDVVLALLVAFANKNSVKVLLLACVAIDMTDILSAHLSSVAGLFNETQTWSLKLTAIAALIPELAALALLVFQNNQEQNKI